MSETHQSVQFPYNTTTIKNPVLLNAKDALKLSLENAKKIEEENERCLNIYLEDAKTRVMALIDKAISNGQYRTYFTKVPTSEAGYAIRKWLEDNNYSATVFPSNIGDESILGLYFVEISWNKF